MTHDTVEYDFRSFPSLSLPPPDPSLTLSTDPEKHTLWFSMHKKVFERDGINCVVCGKSVSPGESLTSIIPDSIFQQVQSSMVRAGYLPQQELGFAEERARNSIVMCPTHQKHFSEQRFYIRYLDTVRILLSLSSLSPLISRYN